MPSSPNPEQLARQLAELAEIEPRQGEAFADYAVRVMEINRREARRRGLDVITQKSFVRKCGKLRKDLERDVGAAPSKRSVDDPAFAEHMRKITQRRQEESEKGPVRFMAALFATAERARRDPEYKKNLIKHGFQSRMVKPWRQGAEGRKAVKKTGTTTKRKLTKKDRAIELRRRGYTKPKIAKMIKRKVRTVRRYLNGR